MPTPEEIVSEVVAERGVGNGSNPFHPLGELGRITVDFPIVKGPTR